MKKTLITLAAFAMASVANADLILQLDFEDGLTTTTNTVGLTVASKGTGSLTYTETGLTEGSNLGTKECELTLDLGKAVTVRGGSESSAWVTLGGVDTITQKVNMNNSFTLAAYVNFSAFSGNDDPLLAVFGTGSAKDSGLAFGIHRMGNAYEFSFTEKYVQHNTTGAIEGLTADTWLHMAVSYDSTTRIATWYLNGEEVAEQDLSSRTGEYILDSQGSSIGSCAFDETVSPDVTMMLDKVQVYDTALTQNQILEGAGLSIPEPTTATLSLLALAGLAARRRK